MKEPNLVMEAAPGLLNAVSSYSRGDLGGAFQSVIGTVRSTNTARSAVQKTRQTKTSPADVVRTLPFSFFFQVTQIICRYHGVGARTRRRVQMLLRLVLLLVP